MTSISSSCFSAAMSCLRNFSEKAFDFATFLFVMDSPSAATKTLNDAMKEDLICNNRGTMSLFSSLLCCFKGCGAGASLEEEPQESAQESPQVTSTELADVPPSSDVPDRKRSESDNEPSANFSPDSIELKVELRKFLRGTTDKKDNSLGEVVLKFDNKKALKAAATNKMEMRNKVKDELGKRGRKYADVTVNKIASHFSSEAEKL